MTMTIETTQFGSVKRITADWTTDGAGAASGTVHIAGTILRVVHDPGSPAPTDDYDVTLTDEFGMNLLAGLGANRDTTTTEKFCPGVSFTDGTTTSVMPIAHYGACTLAVANGGAAKVGKIVLFVKA
jgi:hypothetical protein